MIITELKKEKKTHKNIKTGRWQVNNKVHPSKGN